MIPKKLSKSPKQAFSLIELSIVILIIGILVAGVTSSSRLIKQMRLTSARSITRSAPVSSITGLVAWFETTNETALDQALSDNDAVASWNDINPQSSFKYNLTQTNNSYRPLYVSNGIGGIPSLKFTNHNMTIDNFPIGLNFTYFLVFYRSQTVSTNGMDLISMSSSGNHGVLIEIQPNTGAYLGMNRRLRLLYRSPPGAASQNDNYTSASGQILDNSNYIATITRDRSALPNGINNIYLNGVILNEAGYNSASVSTSLDSYNMTFLLGNLLPGNYVRPFDGMISEIIIFDRALKSDEISDINKYLAKKYSIKIS